MCFGSSDSGAKQAAQQSALLAQQEAQRQSNIQTGTGEINSAFSKFDPAYFDKYKQDYIGNYMPGLENQFGQARGSLTATLARKGMLESTVGADQEGRLQQQKDQAGVDIANRAQDATNQLEGNVNKAKGDLMALNTTSADPQAINNLAIGQGTSLAAPAAYSPLGDVFGSFLAPMLSNAGAGGMSPYGRPYASSGGGYNYGSGSGSGRVYG